MLTHLGYHRAPTTRSLNPSAFKQTEIEIKISTKRGGFRIIFAFVSLKNSISQRDKNLKVLFEGSIELVSTTNLPSFSQRSSRVRKIQNIKFSLHF